MKNAGLLTFFLMIISACDNAPSQSGYAKSGQNQIYFESHGSGSPVVFIHGGGVDLHMWRPQIEALSKNHQVITYDLRGHGKSEYKDNSLKDIDDLKALLKTLGLQKVNLVGLSLGATMAVDFVLDSPEMVNKMILMSPGLAGYQEQDDSYLQPIIKLGGALQNGEVEKAAEIVTEITFHGSGKRTLPSELDTAVSYVKSSFIRYVESNNYTRFPQFLELQPVNRLHEIEIPVLLIHGDQHANYITRNVEKLSSEIKDSRVIKLKNAGHLLNVEKANEVNRHLIELFN